MRRGDEAGVAGESGETFSETNSIAEEVNIPDYVVLDFLDDAVLPVEKTRIKGASNYGASSDPLG